MTGLFEKPEEALASHAGPKKGEDKGAVKSFHSVKYYYCRFLSSTLKAEWHFGFSVR